MLRFTNEGDVSIALSLAPYFVFLCVSRTLQAFVAFALLTLLMGALLLLERRAGGRVVLRDPFHLELTPPPSPSTPVCSEPSSTDSEGELQR